MNLQRCENCASRPQTQGAAKICAHLYVAINVRQQTKGRVKLEMLQSQKLAERFSTDLQIRFSESTHKQLDIREL